MKFRTITIGITIACVAILIGIVADNDRVLRGDKGEYVEVFKRDSKHGEKNYLYTETEFTDRWGRHCTVTTGDSEKTIALDCDDSAR